MALRLIIDTPKLRPETYVKYKGSIYSHWALESNGNGTSTLMLNAPVSPAMFDHSSPDDFFMVEEEAVARGNCTSPDTDPDRKADPGSALY
jgi:hypothetical protein